MIITRTPFRVSFVGGGSDLPAYYLHAPAHELRPGCVFSMAIQKYMYIIVNERFDNRIRVSYSATEIVDNVDQIQHDIVREALKIMDIASCIEIVSVSDIPKGTGLGSSSSFTVGLLLALQEYRNRRFGARENRDMKTLAEMACEVEIHKCGKPIGKQDQYAAALGGFNRFYFYKRSVGVQPAELTASMLQKLWARTGIFYIGGSRSADTILKEQSWGMDMQATAKLALLADLFYASIQLEEYDKLGNILREAWEIKRSLASGISDYRIDELYEAALKAGALGGKVLGAGGAGFMLLYSKPEDMARVSRVMHENGAPLLQAQWDAEGATVL